MSENNINLMCTICSGFIVCPRFYENCGHTICEECMVKNDKLDIKNNKYVFEATQYKCPLCRTITLKPWYKRPLNHMLINILEDDNQYRDLEKERIIQRKIDIGANEIIQDQELISINMSKLSYSYRDNMAEDLYHYILPSIYDAVMDGKPYIIIKERIKELRSVSDLISQKLIRNNNIYRVFSTNTEFTVEIIPIQSNIKYNYTNEHFNENLEEDDDEIDIDLRGDEDINIIPVTEITQVSQTILHASIDLHSMNV
jgi:hypothetical protein